MNCFYLNEMQENQSNVLGQCCFVCVKDTGCPVYIGRVNFQDYPATAGLRDKNRKK